MQTIFDLYKDDSEDGRGVARKVISGDSLEALTGWVRTQHPDAQMETTPFGTRFTVGFYIRYEVRKSALISVEDVPEMEKAAARLVTVKAAKNVLIEEEQTLSAFLGGNA